MMKNLQLLDRIEAAGNRLPNPTLLFVYLCVLILILSALSGALSVSATHPVSGATIEAINLLSVDGLHKILANTVKNFVQFAPVGTVLVAILGIGIAEHAGLLAAVLKAVVVKAPKQLLSFVIVLAGILSSLAADTGYVVLIPLAALMFASVGRHPIAGIAAAFAGVSGGYSANLLIGPLDAILAGISTEAAALVQPNYEVSAAGNYYFILVSTLLVALIGTWVTEKVICKRWPGDAQLDIEAHQALNELERRGLKAVGLFTVIFAALLLWALVPENGILRDQQTQSVLKSPFIKGIVTIIALYAGIAGVIYGRVSQQFSSNEDIVSGMEKHMGTMASYLVLMFFAAQFVSYFAWSNLGSIIAINGASILQKIDLGAGFLLISFIALAGLINLFIGSASAKWALLAPIFVPMLLLSGISPEATQVAYRIGDSSTNIITPLMPYFGVVVAFAQQHQKSIGIGSIIAMMLPYSLAFLFAWSALLLLWIGLDLPLGPGAPIFVPR